ncbi:hypothetical protein XENTR_v10007417 [Xenopus tropicalis]|nr:hypothetical protein XENTR_v10007417 [Xenopus tropicalis]
MLLWVQMAEFSVASKESEGIMGDVGKNSPGLIFPPKLTVLLFPVSVGLEGMLGVVGTSVYMAGCDSTEGITVHAMMPGGHMAEFSVASKEPEGIMGDVGKNSPGLIFPPKLTVLLFPVSVGLEGMLGVVGTSVYMAGCDSTEGITVHAMMPGGHMAEFSVASKEPEGIMGDVGKDLPGLIFPQKPRVLLFPVSVGLEGMLGVVGTCVYRAGCDSTEGITVHAMMPFPELSAR